MAVKTQVFNCFRAIFKIRFLETLLRKAIFNKSPDSIIAKLAPNHYQYKPNTWRRFKRDGITVDVDISDYIGHYFYFGFFDESLHSLKKLVDKGDVILDVGANIGITTLYLADKTGETGKVYSFEPDAYNYKQLKKNISLNSFRNVEAYNIGLGHESGSFKLFVVNTGNRGRNTILNEKEIAGKDFCHIKIGKLDVWVTEQKISRLNLIKIDVEGFEYNVLLGAENSIKKFKPKLFIELDDNNLKYQGHSARELVSLLEKFGYKVYDSRNEKQISSLNDFSNCHFDIIALPDR